MPQYSRKTILAATDLLEHAEHGAINRFLLEHDIAAYIRGGTERDRANSVAEFLLTSPELEEEGRNLTDVIVEEFVAEAIHNCTIHGDFDYAAFSERYAKLDRSLPRD